jgi:energy-coupling factor transporter ATP-binding protein EcfA2
MHDPKLIYLDEPFTALDHPGSEMLVALVREVLCRDRAVIFTTHRAEYVSELASRVVQIENGTLRHEGIRFAADHKRSPVAA